MENFVYERLKQDFIKIRHLFSDGCYDETLFNETLDDIKIARVKIAKKTKGDEKRLLLYCIDTLVSIIGERDRAKTFDFADTVHNVPEICMGMRNVYSFRREIRSFQKKYGEGYFSDFKKIKPKFQRHAPKNKWEYFYAESDYDFEELHPIGYKILCVIGVIVLCLPLLVYVAYTVIINPTENKMMEFMILFGFV